MFALFPLTSLIRSVRSPLSSAVVVGMLTCVALVFAGELARWLGWAVHKLPGLFGIGLAAGFVAAIAAPSTDHGSQSEPPSSACDGATLCRAQAAC